MSLFQFARAVDRAVFHCPICEADRVGLLRKGAWQPPGETVETWGYFVECSGCMARVSPSWAMNSVVATDFTIRMREGSRSLLATTIVTGERTGMGIAMAIDTVEKFSSLTFSIDEFVADLGDPELPTRFRGDLILLSETLRPPGASTLLRAAVAVGEASGGFNHKQRSVIEDAGAHLRLATESVRLLFA